MNTLKEVTRNWWSFIIGIWRHRETIAQLCDSIEAIEAEKNALRDSVHVARLEVTDLQERLSLERQDHSKTKRQIQTLWRFIAVRHRLDVPSVDGSIRKILREAEQR